MLKKRFLKTENFKNIVSKNDPLSLVKKDGSIDIDNRAMISIKDYLEQRGLVEGRHLLDHFFKAPFVRQITEFLGLWEMPIKRLDYFVYKLIRKIIKTLDIRH